MPLTAHDFDLEAELGPALAAKYRLLTPYVKWKYRKYAQEDRQFIERLIRLGVSIKTIWDVGASNGAWALMACSRLSDIKIEMFEPLVPFDRGYYEVMRYRLQEFPNWHLNPLALGAADGETEIFKPDSAYGSSLIATDYARENWRTIHVPVRSGDSLVADGKLAPPDLVKADLQGFELQMMKGAEKALESAKALLLEAWISRGYGPETPLLTELQDWLTPRGFVLAEINGGYRTPAGQMASVDAFFVKRDTAAALGMLL